MKTSAEPAQIPGSDSGRVIRQKARPGAGTEILGRFEQCRVVLLQVGVQWQDHERQVYIDHAGDHCERRVQQIGRAEHDDPGVDANQEVAGQRQDHQQHQQIAMTLVAAGDQQGQRIGQQQAEQRRRRGDEEGTAEDLGINPVAEEESGRFPATGSTGRSVEQAPAHRNHPAAGTRRRPSARPGQGKKTSRNSVGGRLTSHLVSDSPRPTAWRAGSFQSRR
jgi:hypothetical protein